MVDLRPPIRDRVQGFFGARVDAYTRNASQRSGPDLARLLDRLRPGPDEICLDVGAAVGHTTFAIAEIARAVLAVDLTPAMLRELIERATRRGASHVRAVVGDAEALPLPDASFDVVTTRRTMHHVPAPARAVREIARVLRPGGRAGLVDMAAPDDDRGAALFNRLEQARDDSHVRALGPVEWHRVVRAAGLEIESLDVLLDRIPWNSWLSPLEPGGREDRLARSRAVESHPELRSQVVADDPEGRVFLKRRIVLVARKPGPETPS